MNKKVLIIDNDRDLTAVLRSSLEFIDCEVITAENVAEASRILRDQPPDIVLAEILFPHSNVLDLVYQLSDIGVPMIITGIKSLDCEERKRVFCNQVPFFQKPILPNILVEKVQQLLNEKHISHSN